MSVKQSQQARLAREMFRRGDGLAFGRSKAMAHIGAWTTCGHTVGMEALVTYVEFVYAHGAPDHPTCEHHHVFPKSLFPELHDALWNLVPLAPEHHFQAHALLTDLVPTCAALARAFMGMCGRKVSIRGREVAKQRYIRCKALLAQQLQVRVGDAVVAVDRQDPRVLAGELRHFNTGKPSQGPRGRVVVLGPTGAPIQVAVTDPRYLSGELQSVNAKTVTVVAPDGKRRRVSTTDPAWESGELQHMNAGTVSVRNPVTGECFRVSTKDPRWLDGSLVHRNKGTFPARSLLTGETCRLSKTDPRYLSGEFVHINRRTTQPLSAGADPHVS